jgi:hypothetical protein
MTTNCGNIGTDTKTWTDELLLNWGKIVHSTLIIHTVAHVEDLLATTPLLPRNISKAFHLPLARRFHDWFKIGVFDNRRILYNGHIVINLRWD